MYIHSELIWAFIKKKVAKENVRKETLEVVKDMVESAFDDVTPELTRNCVRHAMELMQRDYDAELKFDQEVEPLIIRVVRTFFKDLHFRQKLCKILYNSLQLQYSFSTRIRF